MTYEPKVGDVVGVKGTVIEVRPPAGPDGGQLWIV